MSDSRNWKYALGLALAAVSAAQIAGCNKSAGSAQEAGPDVSSESARKYADGSDGADWPGYGRTFGEQHYSPLSAINAENVGTLGLAWHIDLPQEKASAFRSPSTACSITPPATARFTRSMPSADALCGAMIHRRPKRRA